MTSVLANLKNGKSKERTSLLDRKGSSGAYEAIGDDSVGEEQPSTSNQSHPSKSGHKENTMQFPIILLIAQSIIMVLYGIFVRYNGGQPMQGQDEHLTRMYPWFQDTHVMIVVGFGFLMTFLKRYGWSSVGFNFLFTGFTIQWALLVTGFFHDFVKTSGDGFSEQNATVTHYIAVNIDRMLEADFTTGAILISFGAVLGIASPVQLLLMIILEVVFYNINSYILSEYIMVSDIGGSMVIHAFGAYFGLSVARVLYKDDGQMDNQAEGAEYHSDVFSMIGTVFLWMFWPSFNSATAGDPGREYAIINTYLALSAACCATFIFSMLFNPKKRITMEHIQNATLAGGVAMGTSADMMVQPLGALLIGFSAGLLSTAGYAYIKPFLADKMQLHDTCGVHNLHGMPAIFAAVVSIITCAATQNSPFELDDPIGSVGTWSNQLFALFCTLAMAVSTGSLTGALLRIPAIEHLSEGEYFEDGKYWEIESEDEN